jgi:xylose isomerase
VSSWFKALADGSIALTGGGRKPIPEVPGGLINSRFAAASEREAGGRRSGSPTVPGSHGMQGQKPVKYQFSFGPWNLGSGADPFGPSVRKEIAYGQTFKLFKDLGFDYVQFHDDDACPDADAPWADIQREVKKTKKTLDGEGLKAEFVAPRLWFHPKTADGAFTSNAAADRKYAVERAKRAADIARMLDCDRMVIWPAREGTYIREAKDPVKAIGWLLDAVNAVLEHDKDIRILGEMKPNEPTDSAILPTVAHFLALIPKTADPSRVGVLIESAHSILAGIDPSEDMANALWHGKLWGVHLNDQNGLKYDQDKVFGSVDLRRAFNQIWVLERGGFGRNGEVVGLDVKAMRTTKDADRTKHLTNSKEIFQALVELVRALDTAAIDDFRARRDHEGLEGYILRHLMGRKK